MKTTDFLHDLKVDIDCELHHRYPVQPALDLTVMHDCEVLLQLLAHHDYNFQENGESGDFQLQEADHDCMLLTDPRCAYFLDCHGDLRDLLTEDQERLVQPLPFAEMRQWSLAQPTWR
jgi:hypothetical protein